MQQRPQILGFGPAALAGIGLLSLMALVAALWFGLAQPGPTYDEQRAANRLRLRDAVRVAAAERLDRYAWIDRAQGIIQVPLARAGELELARLQGKAVGPSQVPVEKPYPAGLAPAPAPAPAPTATPAAPPPTPLPPK